MQTFVVERRSIFESGSQRAGELSFQLNWQRLEWRWSPSKAIMMEANERPGGGAVDAQARGAWAWVGPKGFSSAPAKIQVMLHSPISSDT